MMKRFWMGLMTVLLAIAVTITINYAWFVKSYDVNPLADGSSVDAYYYTGSGTEQDPYVITTPRHLYNLAWLQYLGKYNRDAKSGTTFPATYFRLGMEADGTLDMSGWPLPPIGTTKYPFIGNFNGNGWTITGLTTTNTWSEFGTKHPSTVNQSNFEKANCSVIGFFGSIGAFDGTVISDQDTTVNNAYSYDTTNNKVYKFYLNDNDVHTSHSTTLIGAVAGYVNATIEDVGVIQPHLNIQATGVESSLDKTDNLSDFAVVGYAEAKYTTQKTKESTIIYNPTYNYSHFNFKGMGSQADWGGSMDMQKLHARINSVATSTTKYVEDSSVYPAEEIRYGYDSNKESLYKNGTFTYTGTQGSNNTQTLYYKNQGGSNGTYLKNYTQSTNGQYQCLTALYKDVYTITRDGVEKTGYKIHDGNNHYLSYDADNDEYKTVGSAENATIWLFENNKLYTFDEKEFSTTIIRYLNGTTDLVSVLTSTSSTTWTWDSTFNTFKYTYNNYVYYLNCVDGVFKMCKSYIITDNNGNYMRINNGNIENTRDVNLATKWVFSIDGEYPRGYIYEINDSAKRISYSGSSLIVNDSGSYFSYDGTNISTGNGIIKFDGNNWVWAVSETFLIHQNGHYLSYNNGLSDTTNRGQAKVFYLSGTLSNTNGTGKIYFSDGNNTRYLRYNNGLTTTINQNDSGTDWAHDTYGYYYNDNGTRRYIKYDGSWRVDSSGEYYISYNGNYLSANGTTISNATTQNTATSWKFSNFYNGSGTISTVNNNTTYYLQSPTVQSGYIGYLSLTTTSHDFVTTNGYLKDSSTNCYVIYYEYGDDYPVWWTYNGQDTVLTFTAVEGQFANVIAYSSDISIIVQANSNISRTANGTYNLISTYSKQASVFNCIPINASSSNPYSTDNSNTGYIMSGGYDTSINCDIRVSYFGRSYISKSWNGSSWIENSVYTIGNNGFGKIIESGSGSGTYYPVSNFSKYSSAKSQLINTLGNSGGNVYGLHFMDAAISKNHLVTTASVLINGDTYTNYQMPEDCIDFNLKSKGSINCFSGYYFSGNGGTNNAFFSLHEIIRNSDKSIDKILHILKVYENKNNTSDNIPDGTYVYQYINDDNSSDTGYYYYDAKTKQYITITNFISANFDLKFDKEWIENPVSFGGSYNTTSTFYNQYKNNFFYFEVPVNAGEYALGSVSGKCGTYLVYLDIGANASVVDRTAITEQMDETTKDLTYVNGIQVLAATNNNVYSFVSAEDSAVAIIASEATGVIDIERTENSITFSRSLNSTYWGEQITVTNGSLTVPTSSKTTKVLKYLDFNNGTNSLYYTTVWDIGGTKTYQVQLMDGNTNPIIATHNSTTEQIQAAEYGLLKIGIGDDAGYGIAATAAEAISSNTFSNSTTTLDYYFYIATANKGDASVSYDMSVDKITGDETHDGFSITTGTYTFTDGYTSTHCYKLISNDITLVPNGLLVYIGPTLKASAGFTGPTSNVVTVTTVVNNVTYTFTFNANAIDNTAKTITIYYVAPETP